MLQANSLIAHYHNYLIQIVTYSEDGIQIQHTVENIHNQTQDHIPVLQHNELISFSIKKKQKNFICKEKYEKCRLFDFID